MFDCLFVSVCCVRGVFVRRVCSRACCCFVVDHFVFVFACVFVVVCWIVFVFVFLFLCLFVCLLFCLFGCVCRVRVVFVL